MADNDLRDLEREWSSSGTYEDRGCFMRCLDRAGRSYVVPVAPEVGREGQWFEFPIADLEFGSSSPDRLNWLDAWTYAKEQGGVLQSLGDALNRRVAFYKDSQTRGMELNHSNNYQTTRTINLKFFENGDWYSAFAELPDEKVSFELLAQGFEENSVGRELFRACDDSLVVRLLEQARASDRIRPVQKNDELALSTQQNGSSEYGMHPNIIAVFGGHLPAELNAWYL